MSTYYATKAYVTSLTNAIYQELQEVHSNVHISMLCPGPVNTNFNETANVTFALPGISAKRCVSYCLKEMSKGTLTIVPSPLMRAAVWGSRFTPKKILLSILSKQQKRKATNCKGQMRNPHGRFLICPLCLFMPVGALGFSAKLFCHFTDFTQAVIHTGFANCRI